jgi:hypothetical protein
MGGFPFPREPHAHYFRHEGFMSGELCKTVAGLLQDRYTLQVEGEF